MNRLHLHTDVDCHLELPPQTSWSSHCGWMDNKTFTRIAGHLISPLMLLPKTETTAVSCYSPAAGPDIRPSSACRPVLYLPPLSSANRRVSGNFRSSTHTPSITSRHGPSSHLHKHGPCHIVGRVTTSVMSIVPSSSAVPFGAT